MKESTNAITWNIDSMTRMTSREIAGLTGKQVKHVNRDVLSMLSELEIDKSSFGRIYLDTMNRQQTEYVLDQELTFTLITGYSIKLRNAVIKRWLELEHQVVSLQDDLNKWCAKENCDKAIASIHGKGLAERKKTKKLNQSTIDNILNQMQLKLDIGFGGDK